MSDDNEPMTMNIAAVAMHELFQSLMQAGFTEMQALYIVSTLISSGMK